ncbi:hypothetical protein BDD12DRAFT_809263 [Trichophaea hybrida]|nr:hypothetical protein BDD12DRAFT_809263 [Trichophaea hybrida]
MADSNADTLPDVYTGGDDGMDINDLDTWLAELEASMMQVEHARVEPDLVKNDGSLNSDASDFVELLNYPNEDSQILPAPYISTTTRYSLPTLPVDYNPSTVHQTTQNLGFGGKITVGNVNRNVGFELEEVINTLFSDEEIAASKSSDLWSSSSGERMIGGGIAMTRCLHCGSVAGPVRDSHRPNELGTVASSPALSSLLLRHFFPPKPIMPTEVADIGSAQRLIQTEGLLTSYRAPQSHLQQQPMPGSKPPQQLLTPRSARRLVAANEQVIHSSHFPEFQNFLHRRHRRYHRQRLTRHSQSSSRPQPPLRPAAPPRPITPLYTIPRLKNKQPGRPSKLSPRSWRRSQAAAEILANATNYLPATFLAALEKVRDGRWRGVEVAEVEKAVQELVIAPKGG